MTAFFLLCTRRVALAMGLGAFVLSIACTASSEAIPLRIPRVIRPPKLSDFLEGRAREAEAVVTVFKQFDPHDGEAVSQPTTAYLSYDRKNLYVGWICKDDPKLIRARVAPRKQIDTDDRVTINIDTFQDHKHAYWFDVNPYGVQYDGRTTDGIGDDPSWEGLWYSEGRITENGYVVLETIPFKSIRFPKGRKQIWNICLARAIQRNNEFSVWPFISHARLPEFVGQFAPIEIDEDISPGRNIQLIPYGIYSRDKYLDPSTGFQRQTEHHPGLDAKAVIHDALTLDVAVNPDFSEIGSDDPQVQVNQRYEVIYPERRPFFLENASVFSMPEQLFFSRRIVDPQFGAKLTGSLGRWSVGAMVADDRAPGEVLVQGESGHGDRAVDGVFRAEREFGHQSHVGLFFSDSTFQSRANRVASIDARYIAAHNWIVSGQATTTQTELSPTGYKAGPGYILGLSKSDNHVYFKSVFTDRSPGLNATLAYISRTDIRRWDTISNYQWKPTHSLIFAYGPGFDSTLIYDHEQKLQNWSVTPMFTVSLPRLTSLNLQRTEAYEFYHGIGFREHSTSVSLLTAWLKWMDLNLIYVQGTSPIYYPVEGVPSFLGDSKAASAQMTLRPNAHLRMDEIYYYTRLATMLGQMPSDLLPSGTIFTNHLIRSKINYQFTRDYSLRAIMDYNSLLSNASLVSSGYAKQADATLLFTYLPHPGTAVYLGYADTFQNVDYEAAAAPAYSVTTLPGTSTDRQIFLKFSYLLRF
jgi:Domain of unknown function (DUF5916)/Carbohydrate family 9 binding domain-like